MSSPAHSLSQQIRHGASALGRELSVALAVLSIWLLALLSPYHQTAPVLRLLAQSGHEVAAQWSLCASLAESGEESKNLPICPVQAIGKDLLDTPAPAPFISLDLPRLVLRLLRDHTADIAPRATRHSPIQPRAPPQI